MKGASNTVTAPLAVQLDRLAVGVTEGRPETSILEPRKGYSRLHSYSVSSSLNCWIGAHLRLLSVTVSEGRPPTSTMSQLTSDLTDVHFSAIVQDTVPALEAGVLRQRFPLVSCPQRSSRTEFFPIKTGQANCVQVHNIAFLQNKTKITSVITQWQNNITTQTDHKSYFDKNSCQSKSNTIQNREKANITLRQQKRLRLTLRDAPHVGDHAALLGGREFALSATKTVTHSRRKNFAKYHFRRHPLRLHQYYQDRIRTRFQQGCCRSKKKSETFCKLVAKTYKKKQCTSNYIKTRVFFASRKNFRFQRGFSTNYYPLCVI